MTKHETREYAFLLLYEAMVRTEELNTIEDLYASTEEMLELPIPEKVKQYVSGVMSQTEELDSIIAAHSKQRSLNRVPAVNRSILRLALYELKNMPQTPVNVVISEAVHLSQAYAYPEDTAFINGVLGAYARSKPAARRTLPMAQILGIDTSNYTTSAALLDLETGEVHQEKQLLPVKVGEVGLRQSDAVFHHTRQLPELLERLRPFLENNPVCGVSVSTRPRNVDGSYMPCFLTGMGTARAVAAVSGVPLYETSHQVGHVLAALYSAGKLGEREKPFLAFHVSGGTTDSLYCEPDADMALKITPCGTSLDLKAGQAIDRVGLMLGLQFPCGKALEQLAAKSRKTFRIKPVVRGMDCCLSGLENQCRKRLEQGEPPEDVAKFCLLTVAETVIAMTKEAQERYGRLPVLYAGGVMSNQLIRPLLAENAVCWFAAPEFACDNAAGVAVYGAWRKQGGKLWQF